jgi:hypothetical protein
MWPDRVLHDHKKQVTTWELCPDSSRYPDRMGKPQGKSRETAEAGPAARSDRDRPHLRKGARMATRAVARRQAGGTSSVRAAGGEVADRDLVGMYLDEIARTPLLDAAKEVELSRDIEAGVYAERIPRASAPRTSSSGPTSASS